MGVDSFNPFIVTMIPLKLKEQQITVSCPSVMAIPCAQTPLTDLEWTKERTKEEHKERQDT